LKIEDGEEKDKVPFLQIGISEFNEPLKVQTTEDIILEEIGAN
jgi:hypothetical protein